MTEPEIRIRQMYATDLNRGFLDTLAALRPTGLTAERAVEVFRFRLRQKIQTYVALVNDRVVGTASLLIEPKFIHNGGLVGHVEDVAVHPDQQGLGLGKLLVDKLIDECREAGCYKIILDCEESLVAFYERRGFRRWCGAMRMDL